MYFKSNNNILGNYTSSRSVEFLHELQHRIPETVQQPVREAGTHRSALHSLRQRTQVHDAWQLEEASLDTRVRGRQAIPL